MKKRIISLIACLTFIAIPYNLSAVSEHIEIYKENFTLKVTSHYDQIQSKYKKVESEIDTAKQLMSTTNKTDQRATEKYIDAKTSILKKEIELLQQLKLSSKAILYITPPTEYITGQQMTPIGNIVLLNDIYNPITLKDQKNGLDFSRGIQETVVDSFLQQIDADFSVQLKLYSELTSLPNALEKTHTSIIKQLNKASKLLQEVKSCTDYTKKLKLVQQSIVLKTQLSKLELKFYKTMMNIKEAGLQYTVVTKNIAEHIKLHDQIKTMMETASTKINQLKKEYIPA